MGHYTSSPNTDCFFQGDILKNYPIIVLPDLLSAATSYGTSDLSGTSTIQVKKLITNVLILSHSCDIANRELVAICPVFPITRLEGGQREMLKKGRMNYRFWLPEITGIMDESYADFVIINTVRRDNLDIHHRIASLSERYRGHLADAIYRYFCRPTSIE